MKQEIIVTTHIDGITPKHDMYRTFNLADVNTEYVQGILNSHFAQSSCHVENIKLVPIENGFNSEITDGGIYRIVIDGQINGQKAPSLVLKSTTSYYKQKEALFKRLDKLGHTKFIPLLDKYPSNKLAERELMSYLFLPGKIPLRIPELFLGVIDKKTEESWIFMEDLSTLDAVEQKGKEWTQEKIQFVLQNMASFHSSFWGKSSSLDTIDWLGRWWKDRNNDYAAEDVALYAVNACAKLHPDVITKKKLFLLEQALSQRNSTHNFFIQEPQTIIHWDFGPQNIRLDQSEANEKRLVVFDWQTTSIGLPQWDIAQFLMPIIKVESKQVVYDFINFYISMLPLEVRAKIDVQKFIKIFDLVIVDHFFRACAPILFSDESIDKECNTYSEWINCLSWIETESAKWI